MRGQETAIATRLTARPTARLTAIVPTLGRSPHLARCLEALRRDAGSDLYLLVVDQGERPVDLPAGLADRVLRPGRNLGFAGGTDAGLALAATELVATVNDDVLVEPGWTAALVAALSGRPTAAAAQGVNLQLERPEIADGWGLAWDRRWRAAQLGHGEPAPALAAPPFEVFGVSATAALYRRRALLDAALPGGHIFDPRLVSYYEDADLAGRLRACGFDALAVPAARALHAGSTTGRTVPAERWRLIYGNRYLVTARLLGGGFWARLPAMAAGDARDLARAALHGEGAAVAGIAAGWGRALYGLPAFARRGAPAVPLPVLARFR